MFFKQSYRSIICISSISGTLISAFAVFCCGKHDYEKNIVAFFYNILAAILQIATIFLLVGWIWSIRWGILFVQLSGMINNAYIYIYIIKKNLYLHVHVYEQNPKNKSVLLQSIASFLFLYVDEKRKELFLFK
jgi:hypothetical protein